MGSAKIEKLKQCSIRVVDSEFEAKDVLQAIIEDLGRSEIVSCVKSSGYWIVTLKTIEDTH